MAAPSADERVVCATCGTMPADDDAARTLARATWARGTEKRRPVWTCPQCSRENLRSIEGKLDPSWW